MISRTFSTGFISTETMATDATDSIEESQQNEDWNSKASGEGTGW